MRLRKPCTHDLYDAHQTWGTFIESCPGGEFLPEDAELVEQIKAAIRAGWPKYQMLISELAVERVALAILALLADQVGEPG